SLSWRDTSRRRSECGREMFPMGRGSSLLLRVEGKDPSPRPPPRGGEGEKNLLLPLSAAGRGVGGGVMYGGPQGLSFFSTFFSAFFSKIMMCCQGKTLLVSICRSGCSVISLRTCRSVILWTSLIGTFGSSRRYSTNTSRPPGLSALTIAWVIS